MKMTVIPNDNQAAYFYDESVYKMGAALSLLCTAISALAGLLFVVGIFAGKQIGV